MLFLLKGIIFGFSIAAPVGPIGILCIRRTLAKGAAAGIISGLGAATADALYGLIAALGISAAAVFLVDHQIYLRLIGGMFLLYLGYKTFKSRPAEVTASARGGSLLGAYASTLLLTITNPLTIMSFAAVFAALGAGATGENSMSSFMLVVGVFIGSMLWWLILSGIISLLRHKFNPRRLKWINQLSGLIIAGFGIVSLISL